MNMLNGIDIASYQAGINLSNVPADFVIMKATGGVGYVNPYCDNFYQQAKKANKSRAVYHYAHEIGLQGTAEQEAEFFLKNVKGYIGDAILILDWESDNKHDVGWALRWLNYVYEKTGVRPLFYTYTSVLQSYDFSPIYKANYGLWIANYGANRVQGYSKPNPPYSPGFQSTVMYQFTSNGSLAGWNGRLDLNVFYGDAKAWKAYAAVNGKPENPTPEPPKPTPNNGGIKMKEITLNSNVNLRTAAKTSAQVIALLKKGDKVKFDDIVVSGGYIWGVQPRTDKFKKGYLSLGKIDAYGSVK
ncbi:GH25 family lysozyme [Enterococcus dispar]|nr:GH25 family lysozyme [Enterococcus dispar]MCU7356685.1 GH25 family lysozyme [Enterococcus dispar]